MKKILVLRSKDQYCSMQEKANAFIGPSTIGRIPTKIQSGFANFTADKWKNWVLYFSVVIVHDVLPSDVMGISS